MTFCSLYLSPSSANFVFPVFAVKIFYARFFPPPPNISSIKLSFSKAYLVYSMIENNESALANFRSFIVRIFDFLRHLKLNIRRLPHGPNADITCNRIITRGRLHNASRMTGISFIRYPHSLYTKH